MPQIVPSRAQEVQEGADTSYKTTMTPTSNHTSPMDSSSNDGSQHQGSVSSIPSPPQPPQLPLEMDLEQQALPPTSVTTTSPPKPQSRSIPEQQPQTQSHQQVEVDNDDHDEVVDSDLEELELEGVDTDDHDSFDLELLSRTSQDSNNDRNNNHHLPYQESSGDFPASDYDDDGVSVSTFGTGKANGRMSRKMAAAEKERKSLSEDEDRAVRCIRAISFLVLLSTAVTVTYGVFNIIRDGQQESFYNEFDMGSNKILESFHQSVEQVLSSFDSMSSYMTSYASTTNPDGSTGTRFPNVTFPDFEIWGGNVRTLAKGSPGVFYMPLITDDIRSEWEAYSDTQHQHMLISYAKEGALLEQQDIQYDLGDSNRKVQEEPSTQRSLQDGSPYVFRPAISGSEGYFGIEKPNTGPYLPMWHLSPAIPLPGILNFNALDLDFFRGPYSSVLNASSASLGVMTQLNDPTDENAEAATVLNIMLSRGQYRHSLENYQDDPITILGYPIFNNFSLPDRQVAGVLGLAFYWRLLFQNVLSESTSPFSTIRDNRSRNSYIVVVKNTFGQAESFKITGPDVTYLGPGDDYHEMIELDTNRNFIMERSANVAEYISSRASPETRSFTSVDLNTDYLSYELYVYPSKEMKQEFLTNEPTVYAGVVVGIFAFTALFFIFYNFLVESRQRKVVDKAVKSNAVVKSLFPETVHQRLMEDAVGGADNRTSQKPQTSFINLSNRASTASSAMTSSQRESRPSQASSFIAPLSAGGKKEGLNSQFLNRSMNPKDLMEFMTNSSSELQMAKLTGGSGTKQFSTPPIADLFSESTVFFADLAGFTKWSSGRKPTDVFGLLETIYGAFDVLALKHDVFKVETIGDCYVAVTGVPQPQKDHALQMTKFAVKCMYRLQHRLIPKLMDEYGYDETSALSLRIGIHSGPVTAGVLRGERARFQLFGDTVNTAARMESHGIPGKIHCSQATADCLITEGKSNWIRPREGTILAKGKGEMQTYWIESSVVKSAMTTSASVVDDMESVISSSTSRLGPPKLARGASTGSVGSVGGFSLASPKPSSKRKIGRRLRRPGGPRGGSSRNSPTRNGSGASSVYSGQSFSSNSGGTDDLSPNVNDSCHTPLTTPPMRSGSDSLVLPIDTIASEVEDLSVTDLEELDP